MKTLENVKFKGPPLITGPIRLQHEKDLDMTHDLVKDYPQFMAELKVSEFFKNEGCPVSKNDVSKEYDVLDQMFG